MTTLNKALEAYARMLNTLDPSHLEPWLVDGFSYSSQNVFSELKSKAAYLSYITGKFETLKSGGPPVFAEMGLVRAFIVVRPCVVVAQGSPDHLVGLVLGVLDGDLLKRLDMCTVAPHPGTAHRSGHYPGLDEGHTLQ
jgi:hypothetical protein